MAKKKRRQQIVYWGSDAPAIGDQLPADADYYVVDKDISADAVLTNDFRNAVFLLGRNAAVWTQPTAFSQLPANAVLYDDSQEIPPALQRLVALKNMQPLSFKDTDRLVHVLHYDYFPGQWAFKIQPDTMRVAPTFKGTVAQAALYKTVFRGDFGDTWTPLATWVQMSWSYGDWYETLYPELQAAGGAAARIVLRVVTIATGRLLSTYRLDAADAAKGLRFYVGQEAANLMVSLEGRGSGAITVGRLHINRSREEYGHLFVGGQQIAVPGELSLGVAAYFDAGDLKPPLMVYFSGFHVAESFEGNFMMRAFHTPYLLITDNRLAGGAFYFGSAALERKIEETITATLAKLGFSAQDMILTGLSMGSTAALYYGARLQPRAIVIGKPIPAVGTAVVEGRLMRPNDFQVSFDMPLLLAGADDDAALRSIDQHFWQQFNRGDFSRTILGITYMDRDDYNPKGFAQVYAALSNQPGHVQLLHKAVVGRHNDNTPAINRWFVQINRLLLRNEFGREEGKR